MQRKLLLVSSLCSLGVGALQAERLASETNLRHHGDSIQHLRGVEVLAQRRQPLSSITRSQVPLSKLPLSLTQLSAQRLSSYGYSSVPEALRFVPAASFHTSYGAFYQLQVRGFDYTPIVIDGMRDERSTINSFPLSDLSDVESIEVLKGPASVLQGHSSEGGLLSITRRRAIAQTNFRSRLEYGSYGHIRNTTSYGTKLSKHLNGLAGFSYQGGEGWRNTKDKRLKLYGTISGDWSNDALDLRLSYHRDFYGTEAGLPPVLSNDVYRVSDNALYVAKGEVQPRIKRDARYNNESDEMWHKGLNAQLKWRHTFGEKLRLSNQLSYNDDLIDYFSTEELSYRSKEVDKSALPTDAPYPYYYDTGSKRTYIDLDSVQLTYPLRFAHRARMLQNQLNLDGYVYTGTVKHNYSLGYDYSQMWRTSFTGYADDDVTGPGDQSLVSVAEPRSMGYMTHKFSKANPNETQDHGFYIQDLLELGSKWQVMAALRYDIYRYKWASAVATNGGGMDYSYPQQGDFTYITSKALTYRLGLVYSPIEGTSVYASLANIFKPERQGVNAVYKYINDQGELFTPQKNSRIFKPRSGYQMELGLRSDVASWLTADASVYYIKLNNMVKSFNIPEVQADGSTKRQRYYAQIGSIISKGFELSLTARPSEGLELSLAYSLTDARYGDIVSNPYIQTDAATGAPLERVPKHQIISMGRYQLGKRFANAELHYNVNYTSERRAGQSLSYPAYALLDMGASLDIARGLRFGVDVYNVTNHKTYISALGGNQFFPNAPTTFKAHLSYTL